MTSLGVLSIHLDGDLAGGPCAVGCPFCYLGARRSDRLVSGVRLRRLDRAALVDELVRAAQVLDYAELAIALSEPVHDDTRAALRRLLAAAGDRSRARTITATAALIHREPALLDGASRLNLSVDPWKLPGPGLVAAVRATAEVARTRGVEVVAIATLSTPAFADALVTDGLLAALVDLPALGAVALNALKPPPPFCDRAFWLRTLARLGPLLDRALDRRLFLDCYVAARLLGLGGCPGRPDLSPDGRGGLAFRSCVYAPIPDAEVTRAGELDAQVARFSPPAACPFETRLADRR